MKRLLFEYKERDLLRPYIGDRLNSDIDKVHENYKSIKDDVLPTHLDNDEPPLFIPSCSAFFGLTDRLFLGPPRFINHLLDEDIIKNILTLNRTMIDKMSDMRVGTKSLLHGSIHWVHGHGLEGTIRSIVNWYHIPLASLSVRGDLRFLWGILRNEKERHHKPNDRFISSYCEGHLQTHWTDIDCARNSDTDVITIYKTSKVELGEELREVCENYHRYHNISTRNN